MNKAAIALGATLLAVSFTGLAVAHPHEYVNWNAASIVASVGLGTSCPPDEVDVALGHKTFGLVNFCAGHLTANGLGQTSLTLNDDVNNPSVGFYCQDLNDDTWCGGNPSIVPPAPYGIDLITGARGEPGFSFCGSGTLQSPIAEGYKIEAEWNDPVNFGGNWNPDVDVIVFLKGPLESNPAYAPCGLDATATPTHGTVAH